jgi:hypothetical protein
MKMSYPSQFYICWTHPKWSIIKVRGSHSLERQVFLGTLVDTTAERLAASWPCIVATKSACSKGRPKRAALRTPCREWYIFQSASRCPSHRSWASSRLFVGSRWVCMPQLCSRIKSVNSVSWVIWRDVCPIYEHHVCIQAYTTHFLLCTDRDPPSTSSRCQKGITIQVWT